MHPIKSLTRKRTLFKDHELADTPWKKTKGIMLRKKLEKPVLFVLEEESKSRAAIHSFFCLIKFDCIFLDANKKVVDIVENIGPNRPYIPPKAKAKYFIECIGGDAKRLGIRIGERLEW
jgi:uncharacterized protein